LGAIQSFRCFPPLGNKLPRLAPDEQVAACSSGRPRGCSAGNVRLPRHVPRRRVARRGVHLGPHGPAVPVGRVATSGLRQTVRRHAHMAVAASRLLGWAPERQPRLHALGALGQRRKSALGGLGAVGASCGGGEGGVAGAGRRVVWVVAGEEFAGGRCGGARRTVVRVGGVVLGRLQAGRRVVGLRLCMYQRL